MKTYINIQTHWEHLVLLRHRAFYILINCRVPLHCPDAIKMCTILSDIHFNECSVLYLLQVLIKPRCSSAAYCSGTYSTFSYLPSKLGF